MISKGVRRLAAALRRQDPTCDIEQAHRCDDFYTCDSSGAIVGACPLGKIALEFFGVDEIWEEMRAGIEPDTFTSDILHEAGLPQKLKILHPLKKEHWDLADAICTLNDEERWSFDEIATWLEQEADRTGLSEQSLSQSTLW